MRNDQFGSLDLGFKVDETPIVIDSPRPLDFWGMSKKSASKKPWIILENSCLYIWSIFERKRSLSNYYVLEVMGWVKQGPILRSDTKITYISSQSLVWKIVVLKRTILDLYELFYIKFTISLLESRNGISEIDCSVKNKICKNFSRFFFHWEIVGYNFGQATFGLHTESVKNAKRQTRLRLDGLQADVKGEKQRKVVSWIPTFMKMSIFNLTNTLTVQRVWL